MEPVLGRVSLGKKKKMKITFLSRSLFFFPSNEKLLDMLVINYTRSLYKNIRSTVKIIHRSHILMRRSDIVFGIIYLIKHPPKVRFNATTVSS
jgi:hypothetical protein